MKNNEKKSSGAEALAEYAIKINCESAQDAAAAFAERWAESISESDTEMYLTDDEYKDFEAVLKDFVEDKLVPAAEDLIKEWNENAREDYEVMEEGRRGEY